MMLSVRKLPIFMLFSPGNDMREKCAQLKQRCLSRKVKHEGSTSHHLGIGKCRLFLEWHALQDFFLSLPFLTLKRLETVVSQHAVNRNCYALTLATSNNTALSVANQSMQFWTIPAAYSTEPPVNTYFTNIYFTISTLQSIKKGFWRFQEAQINKYCFTSGIGMTSLPKIAFKCNLDCFKASCRFIWIHLLVWRTDLILMSFIEEKSSSLKLF